MKTCKRLAATTFAFFIISFAVVDAMAQKTLTPLETLKAFSVAAKNKDFKTAKKLMTKASLEQRVVFAKIRKMTVDQFFMIDGLPFKTMPEFRNEKIGEEKATVEIRNKFLNIWDELPFVKEEGVWKLDLVTYGKTLAEGLIKETEKTNP